MFIPGFIVYNCKFLFSYMAGKKTFRRTIITVANQPVEVAWKNVKNLNMRVYPNEKSVRISVPYLTPKRVVIHFIKDRLPWIKKQLAKHRERPKLRYESGEQHPVWGTALTLQVMSKNEAPKVWIDDTQLMLQVRPGADINKRKSVLAEWYRGEMKRIIPVLIEKWEPIMGVQVSEFGVKKMKTRWGSCNIRAARIWLNLELAKKRPEMLEYVVVHEMVHLLERLHSKRFYRLMSTFLPNWPSLKNELNGRSAAKDC